jgi:hypothetical protein
MSRTNPSLTPLSPSACALTLSWPHAFILANSWLQITLVSGVGHSYLQKRAKRLRKQALDRAREHAAVTARLARASEQSPPSRHGFEARNPELVDSELELEQATVAMVEAEERARHAMEHAELFEQAMGMLRVLNVLGVVLLAVWVAMSCSPSLLAKDT